MASNEPGIDVIRHEAADSRIRPPRFEARADEPVLDEPRLRDIIRDEIRAERKREARTARADRGD